MGKLDLDLSYSQPEIYKFSQASVFLADKAYNYLKHRKVLIRTLTDFCAGCGVVGLEYGLRQPSLDCITFVELQDKVFKKHLLKNVEQIKVMTKVIFSDYRAVSILKSDLILVNPPFYELSKSRPSPNREKAMAHSFVHGSMKELMLSIYKNLNINSYCFLLQKNDFNEKALELPLGLELVDLERTDLGVKILIFKRLDD